MVKLNNKNIKIKKVDKNNIRKVFDIDKYNNMQEEGDIDVEIDNKSIFYIDNKKLIGILFDEIQNLKDEIQDLKKIKN